MHFRLRSALLLSGLLAGLAACDPGSFGAPLGGSVSPVPEGVRALAAPNQDVDTARLLPEDNCYWYEHTGPVEVTLLPLLTPEGRTICAPAVTTSDGTDTPAG